ncbi:MAG TPA: hypothetical protein VIK93_01850 [Limnochordales bacterium]
MPVPATGVHIPTPTDPAGPRGGSSPRPVDEFRSVNAQIEFLLRHALKQAGRLPGPGEPDDAAGAGEPEGQDQRSDES